MTIRYSDATLYLIGDGPKRAGIESKIAELGLDRSVVLTGILPHSEVLAAMLSSDVVVLASSHEGLPVTAVEAVGLGCRIVATAVGGLPEIVGPYPGGWLVSRQEPDELAATLASAIEAAQPSPEYMKRLGSSRCGLSATSKPSSNGTYASTATSPRVLPNRRSTAWKALDQLGLSTVVRAGLARSGWVCVLALHHVGWERGHPLWSMTPEHFDELIAHCRRVGTIVSVETANQASPSGRPRFVITIDDGYASFRDNVLPVLRVHGDPPIALNIVTEERQNSGAAAAGWSGCRRHRWPWDKTKSADSPRIGPPGGRQATLARALPLGVFASANEAPERPALAAIVDRCGTVSGRPSLMMLTPTRCGRFSRTCMWVPIRCTMTTCALPRSTSSWLYIRGCRRFFELLDRPLDLYAFPNGDYYATQPSILREAGIRYILAVDDRWHRPGTTPITRFTMQRIDPCGGPFAGGGPAQYWPQG